MIVAAALNAQMVVGSSGRTAALATHFDAAAYYNFWPHAAGAGCPMTGNNNFGLFAFTANRERGAHLRAIVDAGKAATQSAQVVTHRLISERLVNGSFSSGFLEKKKTVIMPRQVN